MLHGGSGNPDLAEAVRIGIQKVIPSDYIRAHFIKAREISREFWMGIQTILFPECINAAKDVVKQKMEPFDSVGKAALIREENVPQWRRDLSSMCQ